MKNLLIIILAVVVFGCSKKKAGQGDPQSQSAIPAIELIKAGKDVAWSDGYVLHVDARDGAVLKGIRITHMGQDGQVATITADKGTVSSSGAIERHGILYTNVVRVVLESAHAQRADGTVTDYKDKEAKLLLVP